MEGWKGMFSKRSLWLGLLLAIGVAGLLLFARMRPAAPTQANSSVTVKESGVAALGRFEPEDGVVRVAAPYFESRPSVVAQLLVREGDEVRRGQPIAILDGKPQVEAEVAKANAQVELSERKVTQVKAAAKRNDVAAQQAQIERLEADFRLNQTQWKRAEALYAAHDI